MFICCQRTFPYVMLLLLSYHASNQACTTARVWILLISVDQTSAGETSEEIYTKCYACASDNGILGAHAQR